MTNTRKIIQKRIDKFWSNVDIRLAGECWEWKGRKTTGGYARVSNGQKLHQGVHRFSYELNVGPIPYGMYVCHKCDNRICVNPAHLFIGTHADNMRDMVNKNRHTKPLGEKNPNAKFNEQDVISIISRVRNGETKASVAMALGVSKMTITRIANRKTWKHVNEMS